MLGLNKSLQDTGWEGRAFKGVRWSRECTGMEQIRAVQGMGGAVTVGEVRRRASDT